MNMLRLIKRLHGVLSGEAGGHHASIKSGKKGKTTQQHGQIRLSETLFKIWVRVQAVTSLSLTIPLCSLLCTPFSLHLLSTTASFVSPPSPYTALSPHPLYISECLHFVLSFHIPPSLSLIFLSLHMLCLACAA